MTLNKPFLLRTKQKFSRFLLQGVDGYVVANRTFWFCDLFTFCSKVWFYKCVMKVPSLFNSSFSLFLSFFSFEGSSMKGTKNKNDCVTNSYLTLCLICQFLKICFNNNSGVTFKKLISTSTEVRTCSIVILSIMVMALHQSTFCELWTTRFHWYRPLLSNKEVTFC